MSIQNPFRVGITRDFLDNAGTLAYGDIGLDVLKSNPRVVAEFLRTTVLHCQPVSDVISTRCWCLLLASPQKTVSTANRLT